MANVTPSKKMALPEPPARVVRVAKGSRPVYATLNPIEAAAWRAYRSKVSQPGAVDPNLDEDLARAHMRIRAPEYMAFVLFVSWYIMLPLGIGLGVALGVLGWLFLGLSFWLFALVPVLAIALPFLTLTVLSGAPHARAKSRGREIDKRISGAMSFISAMASADVNIDTIFRELAKEKIYGQVSEEAAMITRDTDLLGIDILTAIKKAAQRSPSRRMQDFLQGVVTTATTGGQLKPYFLIKAEQFEKENQLDLQKRLETMGLMAETYVTVVVAFPLFLVIMIAIFTVVGSGGGGMTVILYAIVGLMLPALEGVFIWMMLLMSKEGQQ